MTAIRGHLLSCENIAGKPQEVVQTTIQPQEGLWVHLQDTMTTPIKKWDWSVEARENQIHPIGFSKRNDISPD